MGKLFDDKGNHIGPTISVKNGVRYRFLRQQGPGGTKHKAGSVPTISAAEIEETVASAVRPKLSGAEPANHNPIDEVERVVLDKTGALIKLIDGSRRVGKSESPFKVPKIGARGTIPKSLPIPQLASRTRRFYKQSSVRSYGLAISRMAAILPSKISRPA
jgi:hypothetical protein